MPYLDGNIVICIDTAFYMATKDDDGTSWFSHCVQFVGKFLRMAIFEDEYTPKIELIVGCEKLELCYVDGKLDVDATLEKLTTIGTQGSFFNFEKWLSSATSASNTNFFIIFAAYIPYDKLTMLKTLKLLTVYDLAQQILSQPQVSTYAKLLRKNLNKLAAIVHFSIMSTMWTRINVGHSVIRGKVESLEKKSLLGIDCVNIKSVARSSLLEGIKISESGYFFVQTRLNDSNRHLFSEGGADICPEFSATSNAFSYDFFLDFVYGINDESRTDEEMVVIAEGIKNFEKCYVLLRPKFFTEVDMKLTFYNHFENMDPFADAKPVQQDELDDDEKQEIEEGEEKDKEGPHEACDAHEFYTNSPRVSECESDGKQDEIEYLPKRYRLLEVLVVEKAQGPLKPEVQSLFHANNVEMPIDDLMALNTNTFCATINKMIRDLREVPGKEKLSRKNLAKVYESIKTEQISNFCVLQRNHFNIPGTETAKNVLVLVNSYQFFNNDDIVMTLDKHGHRRTLVVQIGDVTFLCCEDEIETRRLLTSSNGSMIFRKLKESAKHIRKLAAENKSKLKFVRRKPTDVSVGRRMLLHALGMKLPKTAENSKKKHDVNKPVRTMPYLDGNIVICIDTAFYMTTKDDDGTSWFSHCVQFVGKFLRMAIFENEYTSKIELIVGCEKLELCYIDGKIDVDATLEKLTAIGSEITDHCLESWLSSVPSAFSEKDLIIGFTAFTPPLKEYHFKHIPRMTIIDLSRGEFNDPKVNQCVHVETKNLNKLAAIVHFSIMSTVWTRINVGHSVIRGKVESLEKKSLLGIDCMNIKSVARSSLLEGIKISESGYFFVQSRLNDSNRHLFSEGGADICPQFSATSNAFSYDFFLDFVYGINDESRTDEEMVVIAEGIRNSEKCFVLLRPKFFTEVDMKLTFYNHFENMDPFADAKPEEVIVQPDEFDDDEKEEMEEGEEKDEEGPHEACDAHEFYTNSPRVSVCESEGEQDEIEYLPKRYRLLEVLVVEKAQGPLKPEVQSLFHAINVEMPIYEPISYNAEAISANINKMIRALRKLPERRGLFEKEIYNMIEIVETSQNPEYAYEFSNILRGESYGHNRHIVQEASRAANNFEYMGNTMNF